MFERSKIDNAPEPNAVPAEVTFADGTLAKGKLLVAMGKTVADALNGPGAFIEFEPYGGERSYLAKAQLASVKLVGVPRSPNLQARLVDIDGFDPHRILGVMAGASREELRSAYFAMAKTYHPDRYATAELPAEVRDYLAAMARRINAAHAALDVPERKRAVRAEPVFTSRGQ
jgi:DnaJ-like protein